MNLDQIGGRKFIAFAALFAFACVATFAFHAPRISESAAITLLISWTGIYVGGNMGERLISAKFPGAPPAAGRGQ